MRVPIELDISNAEAYELIKASKGVFIEFNTFISSDL